jgi:osmoprotectant transport system ATP-binding protein
VAGFVGRDRGYRALGFVSTEVAVRPEPAVALGSPLGRAHDVAADEWVLVVDDGTRPQGWLQLTGAPSRDGVITTEVLNLGGTLAPVGGTLREALDAALSSPSGRGVVVDDEGRLLGSVTSAAVLDHVDAVAPPGATA